MKLRIALVFTVLPALLLPVRLAAQVAESPDDAGADTTLAYVLKMSGKFFELENSANEMRRGFATLSVLVDSLENRQMAYESVSGTNQTAITEMAEQRHSELNADLDEVCHKIVGTSEFVKSANVSLNALVLSNALTEYLNQVADLNSPNNTDLGFSITERVMEMVEQDILTHSKKQGKNKGKFLQVVKNIVANPLVQALTVPVSTVVHSLSNVTNTVTQVALEDEDISVEQVENFKNNMRKYVEHYQGLSNATAAFDDKVSNINIRIVALQQLLENFTRERVNTLFPGQTIKGTGASLTQLIRQHYDFRQVEKQVNGIKAEYGDNANLKGLLSDKRLQYPNYALSQSRMIFDEIDALYKECLNSLKSYQTDIEAVLDKSRNIGDSEKIDNKIQDLQKLLLGVEDALYDAVNVEDVEKKFFAINQK